MEASSTPTSGQLFPLSTDFFINAANGRIGIGTEQPAQRLHVEGKSALMNRVGIGTTTPETALHVAGQASWAPQQMGVHAGLSGGTEQHPHIELLGDRTIGGLPHIDFNNVAGVNYNARILLRDYASEDVLEVTGQQNFKLDVLGTTETEQLRVDGRVGIGTTTPETALHVTGIANWAPQQTGVHVGGATAGEPHPHIELVGDVGLGAQPHIDFSNEPGTNYGARLLLREAFQGGNPRDVLEVTGQDDFMLDVKGVARAEVLTVTGGADLAEPFDVNGGAVVPGMVVCIDPDRPGELRRAETAYDRTVAGVVSGANGVRPGMIMGQEGTVASGSHPVALSGRVYVWCDATAGAIQPGDRLTTSDRAGHAMKADDPERCDGAVLGKAMASLDEGTGLVLVLVNLQ